MQGKIVSAVFPKGGEWKSTFIQTVSTSAIMQSYKRKILEADSQNSLSDWLEERDNNMQSIGLTLKKFNHDDDMQTTMKKLSRGIDLLFVDFPGESISSKLTRSGIAFSDLCIIPMRPSDKAIRAFENNMLPIIEKIIELRGNKHIYILPTFAHPNSNLENYRKIFEPYEEYVNVFKNVHIDRSVYTYFSSEGKTLDEHYQTIKDNRKEAEIVKKAMTEVNNIAKEVLEILNKLQ